MPVVHQTKVSRTESDKYRAAAAIGVPVAAGAAVAQHQIVHRHGRKMPAGSPTKYHKPTPLQFHHLFDPRKKSHLTRGARVKGAAGWLGAAGVSRTAAPLAAGGLVGLATTKQRKGRSQASLVDRVKAGTSNALNTTQEKSPPVDNKTKAALVGATLGGGSLGSGATSLALNEHVRRTNPAKHAALAAGKKVPHWGRAVAGTGGAIVGASTALQLASRRIERKHPDYRMTPFGLRYKEKVAVGKAFMVNGVLRATATSEQDVGAMKHARKLYLQQLKHKRHMRLVGQERSQPRQALLKPGEKAGKDRLRTYRETDESGQIPLYARGGIGEHARAQGRMEVLARLADKTEGRVKGGELARARAKRAAASPTPGLKNTPTGPKFDPSTVRITPQLAPKPAVRASAPPAAPTPSAPTVTGVKLDRERKGSSAAPVAAGFLAAGGLTAAVEHERRKRAVIRKRRKEALVMPVTKSERRRGSSDARSAATGAGTVLTGAGLVGGGLPGAKARSEELGGVIRGPARSRAKAASRSLRGGIFGYRTDAHTKFMQRQLDDDIKHGKGRTTVPNHFLRGAGTGKIQPERDIIRHLKVGRKASYALGAAGLGLIGAGQINKAEQRRERDRVRSASAALLGGGTTAAVGGYGAGRLLESEGRKWSKKGAEHLDAAERIAPRIGGWSYGRSKTKVPRVKPHLDNEHIARHGGGVLPMPYSPRARQKAEAAGKLRGAAAQHGYFGHVYGKIGGKVRSKSVRLGTASAVLGAGGLTAKELASKSVAVTVMPATTKERKAEAHRKRTQAALSMGAAGGTLAGFGMRGGGALVTRTARKLPAGAKQVQRLKTGSNLSERALDVGLGAGAVGAGSGLYFGRQQRREAKELDRSRNSPPVTVVEPTGDARERKALSKAQIGGVYVPTSQLSPEQRVQMRGEVGARTSARARGVPVPPAPSVSPAGMQRATIGAHRRAGRTAEATAGRQEMWRTHRASLTPAQRIEQNRRMMGKAPLGVAFKSPKAKIVGGMGAAALGGFGLASLNKRYSEAEVREFEIQRRDEVAKALWRAPSSVVRPVGIARRAVPFKASLVQRRTPKGALITVARRGGVG